MEISSTQLLIGIGAVIIGQFTQTAIMMFKGLSESKVIKTEIVNLQSRMDKQNGKVQKNTDAIVHHVEKFHSK